MLLMNRELCIKVVNKIRIQIENCALKLVNKIRIQKVYEASRLPTGAEERAKTERDALGLTF